jgi:hypothetical protein
VGEGRRKGNVDFHVIALSASINGAPLDRPALEN